MHTKFVLKMQHGEKGEVCKRQTRLLVCRTEEESFLEEMFSPVALYLVIKLIVSSRSQWGWAARDIDFEITFPNERLEKPVYIEMPAHLLSKSEYVGGVFRLRKSLYSLKHTSKFWSKLLIKTLSEFGLTEMNTVPCVFVGTTAVLLCYVDDSILFAADESCLENLYHKLGEHSRVNDLGKPKRFQRLDPT